MIDVNRGQLATVVVEYSFRVLGQRLDREHPHFRFCCDALARFLEQHCQAFAEAGKQASPDYVLRCLRNGEFAHGRVAGCDCVEDILLAALLQVRNERALIAFDGRFAHDLLAWQRSLAPGDPEIVNDLLLCLIEDRSCSGPRIGTYKGDGPMRTWLRRVVSNLAKDRRTAVARIGKKQVLPLPDDGSYLIAPPPDIRRDEHLREMWNKLGCTALLQPLMSQSIEGLSARELTAVLLVIVDGILQERVAELLNRDSGTVGRMIKEALKKVEQRFRTLAFKAGSEHGTISQCLDLQLQGLGEPLLDWAKVRKLQKAAQQELEEESKPGSSGAPTA